MQKLSVPTEKEIEEMYLKIQQNRSEDDFFAEQLNLFLQSNNKATEPIYVGKTSNALAISGANQDLDIIILPRTIAKCMAEADEHYHGHGLSQRIMEQLPRELRSPVMIFKGSVNNSLVVITELHDKEERRIMAAVSLSEGEKNHEINRISSAYGRNNMNNYLKAQIEQGNLLAVNKEKAKKMLRSAGLQLPLEETFLSFDNSIAYSKENVKYPAKENFNKAVEIYGYDDEEEILDLTSVAGIGRR